jgi:hypothetical protein
MPYLYHTLKIMSIGYAEKSEKNRSKTGNFFFFAKTGVFRAWIVPGLGR